MRRLRDRLLFLKENHYLRSVKGGTEVEAMTFEEIRLMRAVSKGVLPMTVKIGGPEARNDILFMLQNGVDSILAPMIESPYSLRNFVTTMKSYADQYKASLAINIETIFSFYNLNEIFESPYFDSVSHVTVGRTDLSSSMGRDVDDKEVIRVTKEIIDLARQHGKTTSTGGRVSTRNALILQQDIKSDTINTRHMTVALDCENLMEHVALSLQWEKSFYELVREMFPARRAFCNKRISSIVERIKDEKSSFSDGTVDPAVFSLSR